MQQSSHLRRRQIRLHQPTRVELLRRPNYGQRLMAQTRYNFCMPVWGPEYIDILLSVGLASQMVSGNLRDFPWAANSIYEFYTTPSDADVLRSAPLVRRLMEWMEVRFIPIGHVESRGKWNTLRRAHQMAVKSADDRDAAILFLSPDQIWSQGSFTNACHRIIEGWSAVLGPGLRSVREAMVPRLRDLYLEFDGSLPIASRDLVREGLATRHPETLMWFWGTPGHFKCPTYLLFDVAEQGVPHSAISCTLWS